jgi:hypothetical protein
MATAFVEGGLPEMLRELGTELHDEDLSESADGLISRDWAARVLSTAARKVAKRIRHAGVPPATLAPCEFTLTVDPADSERYLLPRRARRVLYAKDDSGYYDSLDAGELGRSGFVHEGRAIRFRNVTPTGDLLARVMLDPVSLSYGISAAGTGSTSVVLAATPTIGITVLEADYPVGALIAMESGAAQGEIRRVTAFTPATRACTVDAFSSAPDTYTFLLDLPPVMAPAVVLRAALILLRTDKSLDADKDRIMASYKEAYQDGLSDLKHGVVGHITALRRVWLSGFEETG